MEQQAAGVWRPELLAVQPSEPAAPPSIEATSLEIWLACCRPQGDLAGARRTHPAVEAGLPTGEGRYSARKTSTDAFARPMIVGLARPGYTYRFASPQVVVGVENGICRALMGTPPDRP